MQLVQKEGDISMYCAYQNPLKRPEMDLYNKKTDLNNCFRLLHFHSS